MSEYAQTFGPALAAARQARGLSQYRLADLTDLDPSFLSRLETAARAPGRESVERLVVGLGLDREAGNVLRLAGGFAPK